MTDSLWITPGNIVYSVWVAGDPLPGDIDADDTVGLADFGILKPTSGWQAAAAMAT